MNPIEFVLPPSSSPENSINHNVPVRLVRYTYTLILETDNTMVLSVYAYTNEYNTS